MVVLGGFLGAGKTSCMGALVKWLGQRGLRPGLVTNDQGVGLVDTEMGRHFSAGSGDSGAAAVRQVTGGCFCCRVQELVEALRDMTEKVRFKMFVAKQFRSRTIRAHYGTGDRHCKWRCITLIPRAKYFLCLFVRTYLSEHEGHRKVLG